MRRGFLTLLAVLVWQPAMAAIDPIQFEQDFIELRENPELLETQLGQIRDRFRFVFVAGFLNEGVIGYFEEARETLQKLGVPADLIHGIYPSSQNDVATNVLPLLEKLQALSQMGEQPLVLFGHSKGGAELLAVSLKHPVFFEQKVHAALLVQSAIGGSGIADYIEGVGPEVDNKMPLWARFMFFVAGHSAALFDSVINTSVSSLTTKKMHRFWVQLLKDSPSPKANNIYYIKSWAHPKTMSGLVDYLGWYVHLYYGKGDGFVKLEDQALPQVGQELITLEGVDHIDLVARPPLSNETSNLRRALVGAVLNAID